ncbi:hypothetical protein Aperf_G00000009138 [Anoplocephala perfoliata]
MWLTGAERVYGKLEPTVINEELLTYACFAQGPTGEAGRLAEIEGIAFDSVKKLGLSYQMVKNSNSFSTLDILLVGGLNQFTSLTELLLDNNIIERIEGLDYLGNLRRLDLSFNSIHQIENLEKLVNLEDLSLFHNFVEKIENLDMNQKLRFLSLGRNGISDLENKVEAYERYAITVDQMAEQQAEQERKAAEEEEDRLFMQTCRAAFIDRIHGDNLFNAIFEKDADGKRLCQVSTIEELKLAEIEMDAFPVLTETLLTDIRQHIHDLWNDLMADELALVDQIEDVINEFERNLEEKIGSFIESVQIYADREFVINALSNSKDTHVNFIDSTEEGILKSARSWFNELIEEMHEKDVNQRHINRVTEINLYIDSQRVDLESLDLAVIQ